MAANFGEKLLGEVHEEGLDELLHDLRCLYPGSLEDNASRHRLGIKDLDGLLEVFMSPTLTAEAQTQHLEQTIHPDHHEEHEDPSLQPENVPSEQPTHPAPTYVKRADAVVEVSSTSSAAGKSQLLYYLTAIAVLPSTFSGIQLDGRDSAVVFIDTDGRFDAGRLLTVARGIVQKTIKAHTDSLLQETEGAEREPSGCSLEELEVLLTSSLQHVHVFRPQSSFALLSTLQSLETYLFDLSRHLSSNRPLHAILIDSASAFFWQDKLQDEVARTEDIGRPIAEIERERKQKQSFYLSDMYAELVEELKRLQQQFDCAVIYTTHAWSGRFQAGQGQQYVYKPSGPYDLYNPTNVAAPKTPSFRSSLPAPWGTFPTLRLVVRRDAVRPFPLTMTVHDAQQDAPMRQEVVMQGKFSGRVNGWGREDWPRRIVEGVEERNGGMFTFYVGRDSVDFG